MDYQRIYDQIIDRAKTRKLEGYVERHHILPKCMGGTNTKENLVELTAREHFICHQLLIFIYPKNKKLAYALWGMCNQLGSANNERDYKVSSRTYQTGREAFLGAVTGRTCTWGDSISKTKKGVSQGKRSAESVAKQKQTVANNPYKHSEESKRKISNLHKGVPKSEEHRRSISIGNKLRGIKPPSQAKEVEVGGIRYNSIKAACEALGVPRHVFKRQINNKGNN